FESFKNIPAEASKFLSQFAVFQQGGFIGPPAGGGPLPPPPKEPPGKSPLEILAEQEARARVIETRATGKGLEIRLKIEELQHRMKAASGEEQIAIAQEIAGYRRQLELLQEQTRELEKQKKRLEDINREGERRLAIGQLAPARESEFLMAREPLPTLF